MTSNDQERIAAWLGNLPALQLDAAWDFAVLVRVRNGLPSRRWEFERRLNEIWQRRLNLQNGDADQIDALVCAYIPGDYAEASRFLWEA